MDNQVRSNTMLFPNRFWESHVSLSHVNSLLNNISGRCLTFAQWQLAHSYLIREVPHRQFLPYVTHGCCWNAISEIISCWTPVIRIPSNLLSIQSYKAITKHVPPTSSVKSTREILEDNERSPLTPQANFLKTLFTNMRPLSSIFPLNFDVFLTETEKNAMLVTTFNQTPNVTT